MSDDYGSVIDDVFFGKLKTALVIDDEYPTIDGFLSSIADNPSMSKDTQNRFDSLVGALRKRHPPLIIDVHNGQSQKDEEIVERFYQSDFLVLDWQLITGSEPFRPSLDILSHILANGYFNIVVIDSGEESQPIHSTVLREFASSMTGIELDQLPREPQLPDKILDALGSAFTDVRIGDYLLGRPDAVDLTKLAEQIVREKPPEFSAALELGEDDGLQLPIVDVIVREQISGFQAKDSETYRLQARFRDQESFGYIKCDGAFICVTKKSDGVDPIEIAKKTMKAAGFRPEEILLAALRNELSENGVRYESFAAEFRKASALWYHRLLKKSDNRHFLLDQFISDHADAMVSSVKSNAAKLGERLVHIDLEKIEEGKRRKVAYRAAMMKYRDQESSGSGDQGTELEEPVGPHEPSTNSICEDYYDVDLNDGKTASAAADQHNLLANSVPVRGSHLTCGHIFRLDKEFWVCVTPACSLVPGRTLASQARLNGIDPKTKPDGYHKLPIRIQCLKLHKLEDDKVESLRKKSGSKSFVVIAVDKKPAVLAVKRDQSSTGKMEIETFHVDQSSWNVTEGASSVELLLSLLHVPKTQGDTESPVGEEGADDFDRYFVQRRRVKVMAQLKPEYAASLMRRVSAQSAEIGLDYLPSNPTGW